MVKKKSEENWLRRHKSKGSRGEAIAKEDTDVFQDGQHDLLQDPPQRMQKKIAKRVNFLESVAKSHKLAIQPGIRKKQRRRKGTGAALGDLSSLADALGVAEKDVTQRQQKQIKGLGVGGAKTRKKLASRETVRLQKVLAHPQFQKDPIAAVADHLGATLPPAEVLKKTRKNVSGSQKQKARRQKARLEDEMES